MKKRSETQTLRAVIKWEPGNALYYINEYQLRLGRQRQVWLIPIADERVGVQVKL